MFISLLALTFYLPQTSLAQQNDIGLANAKRYTIGSIEVTGITSYNEQTVIAFTGLRVGDELYLPGDKISKVIKDLWNLNLFSDIDFYVTDVKDGNVVDLRLDIVEVPELNEVTITGIKEKKAEELKTENKLNKGVKVTENLIANSKTFIQNKYKKKGYLNADVQIRTRSIEDSTSKNKVNMLVDVDRGNRVKIDKINFEGNTELKDSKLRKQMKNTKQKNFIRFWKRSKYIEEEYQEDLTAVIDKYKENGYRDARIISDTIIRTGEDDITLNIAVEEGNKYYIGDIEFLGNTVYTDAQLQTMLGLKRGDVYNGVQLKERIEKEGDPDADDLTNLYQNSGYLFSNINPVEVKVENDTIDFEIRIYEGKLAFFNNITVVGNDRTNDHVIYRNLRTRPGQQYSKLAVVSTIRELGQLGFFDPEQLSPEFKNVDQTSGTLDLEYRVVEQGASQIELQGGYGGGGFVGTLGLSFNNFSIQNIFNKEAYQPLPMGDGQRFSLRAQASNLYQTFSTTFVEPWLGGKRPVQFQLSLSHTVQYFFDFQNREADRDRRFLITGGSIGLAKRLQVPDNFFTISHAIGFQHFDLRNYNTGLFTFGNGSSENLSYTFGISRQDLATNPIFPVRGSEFNLTAKFTPPYSVWNGTDYAALAAEREEALAAQDLEAIGAIDQERFNWLEYYKIKFDAAWYNQIADKLVLKAQTEWGFLGAYNNDRGIPPFERFFLGGDGLGGFGLDGREVIALRGYPNQSVVPQDRDRRSNLDGNSGATVYNKYSLELRRAITLKPSASIYALLFAEAGASFDNFRDYNPFLLNRSAGVGVRIFMPAFGLLGIDFGYGFDPIPGTNGGANGWETHFIIGQQF
ncbi:POTRA domain-containing protein [Flavobacteriaceae bacterium YJPT1-3]|nr:POTRA domain-containing protein [Flavobacteriaceae bacterium YJPT1-3]